MYKVMWCDDTVTVSVDQLNWGSVWSQGTPSVASQWWNLPTQTGVFPTSHGCQSQRALWLADRERTARVQAVDWQLALAFRQDPGAAEAASACLSLGAFWPHVGESTVPLLPPYPPHTHTHTLTVQMKCRICIVNPHSEDKCPLPAQRGVIMYCCCGGQEWLPVAVLITHTHTHTHTLRSEQGEPRLRQGGRVVSPRTTDMLLSLYLKCPS